MTNIKTFNFFLFVKTVVLLILFSTNILAQSTHSIMLHIHNRSFDPLQSPLPKTASSSASAATIKPRYFIVQFTSPITQKDRNMLEQMHIRVYDYIPDFAFIVRMSRDRCQMLNNTPRVRWVGPYTAPYKISQEILEHAATVSPKNLSSKTMILRVSIFPDENMADMSSKLSNYGKIINTYRTHWQISFQLEISPKDIPRLSQIQGIKWISTLPSWQLMNNIASSIVNVAQVRKRFGLYGDGQVVAVCDTGLDQGKVKPESLHDDFEDGAGQSRVKNLFNLTQRFFNDNPDDIFSGHGTHVAGTILGNGYLSGSHPKMNYFPDTSYAGIAPKAQLVFQAAEDSTTGMLLGLMLDLNKIFAQAYFADARIHSNSWGATTGSTYSAECADVDQFMWDNKNFLIVFAAGNSGVDMDHDGRIDPYAICSPATAKNCLTVGGSESVRQDDGYTCAWGECWPTLYAKDPIASDHLADNPDGMAAFSSRGPTIDGRFKPDLVAPSTNIISARSSKANLNGWGLTENEHYVFMGGTSMATPMASGTALLMREYLMKIGIDNPSAALIKACLLNAAVSMHPGQYKNDEQQEIPEINPNNVNGWGRLNLEKGVYPTAPISIIYKYTDLISTDETITYYFENLDSQYPIKINLVWTDYPGTPMAQGGLVNDLDFHVVGPDDQIHYPDNAMNKSVVNTLQYDTKYAFFLSDMNVCGMRFTLEKTPSFLDAVSICISNPDAIQDDIWIRVYDISEDKLPGKLRHEKKYQYLPSGWTTLPIDHIEFQSREFLIAIEKNSSDIRITTDIFANSNRGFTRQDNQWKTTNETYSIHAHVRQQNHSTDYDRINNSIGIFLKNPKRGAYQLEISGYNVPHGPQPFALVAYGAIREAPPQKSFSIHMPLNFKEGDGKMVDAGMISIPTPLEQDLVVYLTSSDFTEIIVPPHIIIPAGQDHMRFNVQVVDDPAEDGSQTVIIEARAQDYFPSSISVTVDDNDARPVLVVSPDNIIVPHLAGTAVFTISNAGTGQLEWNATVDSDWLRIVEGQNGIDSGLINVSYLKNNASNRIGHLMVHVKAEPEATQTIAIHQKSEKIETILSPNDSKRYDFFGYATSIWKDQALVGAYKHDANDTESGMAYFYSFDGLEWQMKQKIFANDSSRKDYFGYSVAIHDKQLAVGAYNTNNASGTSGATYIFEYSDNQWTETAKLLAADGERSDYFGQSIGIFNDQIVVGAHKSDSRGRDSGAAYVFEKQDNQWTEISQIIPQKLRKYDHYGCSVAISGNYIIVGAYGDDSRGGGSGAAYIYEKSNNQWQMKTKLIPDASKINDYSGFSVDISGNYAIIGAYKADIKGPNAGAAYVFERKQGRWIEVKSLYPWAAKGYDYFGASVAIDDKYIIVGAYGDSTNGRLAGSAYVFHLKDGIWEQCVFLKASDGDANDKFGSSVCIAETGDAIIGAFGHDSKGSQAGAAYIYSVFAMQASIQTTVPQGLIRSQVQVVDNFSSQPYHKQKHQSQGHYIQQPVETKKIPKKIAIHYSHIPEWGNRIKNLKGQIDSFVDLDPLYITTYIFKNGQWALKASSMTVTNNGDFEIDITRQPGDHYATKIAIFVHSDQQINWPLILPCIPERLTNMFLLYDIIQRKQ